MSEAPRFTEGEWWVRDRTTNGVPGYEICWSPEEECVTDHVYERADAFLMAASKEMYAAIQLLIDALERSDAHPEDAIGACRSALAKAREE